jgi:hypothetical protein
MIKFSYYRIHVSTHAYSLIESFAHTEQGAINYIKKLNEPYYYGNLLWFFQLINCEKIKPVDLS